MGTCPGDKLVAGGKVGFTVLARVDLALKILEVQPEAQSHSSWPEVRTFDRKDCAGRRYTLAA